MDKCFIASSSEAQFCALYFMDILDAVLKQANLNIECILWRDAEEFSVLNDATLTRLISLGQREIAYSIAFFTPDDLSTSRGQSQIIARDNVLFEYGLFLGMLGEKRSFAIIPQDEKGRNSIKLPSDIGGVTLPRYKFKGFDCTQYSRKDFFNAAISIVSAIKKFKGPPESRDLSSVGVPPENPIIGPRTAFQGHDSGAFSSY